MELDFRHRLQAAMKEQGTTVKALSAKTGVPVSTIRDWLNGAQPKDLEALKKVCDVLKQPFVQLVFGEKPLEPTVQQLLEGIRTKKILRTWCRLTIETIDGDQADITELLKGKADKDSGGKE